MEAMRIKMESEEQMAARGRKNRKKRGRPDGLLAPRPVKAAKQAKEELYRREREWLRQLQSDPSSFADVEREVHARMRFHADVFVAGLLAKASSDATMDEHVTRILNEAQDDLRAAEKNAGR